MTTETTKLKARSASDAIIDGLIAGILAGFAMIVIVIFAGFSTQFSLSQILASFGAGQETTPLGGALVHLSVSGIYGAVFGLLMHWLPQRLVRWLPGWLAGLVYAGCLLMMALGILLPGVASPLAELPLWILALGHAAYGAVLGWRVIR